MEAGKWGEGRMELARSIFGAEVNKTVPINGRSYNGGVNNMEACNFLKTS
jgi:hypothetical protein